MVQTNLKNAQDYQDHKRTTKSVNRPRGKEANQRTPNEYLNDYQNNKIKIKNKGLRMPKADVHKHI